MAPEQITTIIVAILGSGALSALITAFATRKKTDSEAQAIAFDSLAKTSETLMSVAEVRIKSLCERVDRLEKQVEALQKTLEERDNMIDTLQDENRSLKEQLDQQEGEMVKIRRENESLRKRIKELENQVFALTRKKDDSVP